MNEGRAGTTVGPVTEQPHNEFLPKPAWRLRAAPGPRAVAITVTFASMLVLGGVVIGLLVAALRALDAPGWLQLATWLIPAAAVTVWACRPTEPATVSDVESQGWGEYVARYVMVGNEEVRPLPLRVVTGVLFGAPVAGALVVFALLALLGIL